MKEKTDIIEKRDNIISKDNKNIKDKIDKLNDLSYDLRKSDPKKALSYGIEANKLASEISYSKGP